MSKSLTILILGYILSAGLGAGSAFAISISVNLKDFDRPRLKEKLTNQFRDGLSFFEEETRTAPEKDVKFSVDLYATQRAYAEGLKIAGGEKMINHPGFSSYSGQTLLKLFTADNEYLSAVEDLPDSTLYLAVHELFHQYTAKVKGFVSTRYLPSWYVEGQAEYFASNFIERTKQDRASLDVSTQRVVESWFSDDSPGDLRSLFEWSGVLQEKRNVDYYGLATSLYRFLKDSGHSLWTGRLRVLEDHFKKISSDSSITWDLVEKTVRHVLFSDSKDEVVQLEKAWRNWLPHHVEDWFLIYGSGSRIHNGKQIVLAPFDWMDRSLILYSRKLDANHLDFNFELKPVDSQKEFEANISVLDDPQKVNDGTSELKVGIILPGNGSGKKKKGYVVLKAFDPKRRSKNWSVVKEIAFEIPNLDSNPTFVGTASLRGDSFQMKLSSPSLAKAITISGKHKIGFPKKVYVGLGSYRSAVIVSCDTPDVSFVVKDLNR